MNQRERLIELLKGAETKVTETLSTALSLEEWLGIYADHLLNNGVIVPPCKVGDIIYAITSDSPTGIEETRISQIKIKVKENGKILYRISAPCVYDDWGEAHWNFCEFDFGKTVFTSREEAEAELERRKK